MNEPRQESVNPFQPSAVDATEGVTSTAIISTVDTSTEPTRFRWQVIPAVITTIPLIYTISAAFMLGTYVIGSIFDNSPDVGATMHCVSTMAVSCSLGMSIHAWWNERAGDAIVWTAIAVAIFVVMLTPTVS